MSIPPVTPPSNPPQNPPLFHITHLAFQGTFGVGGDFAARTELSIYPDRATVATKIMKYSALPVQAQRQLDPLFFKSLGANKKTTVLCAFGPRLQRQGLSEQDRQQCEKAQSDGSPCYPLVKQVTMTNIHETPVEREQIKRLTQMVATVVDQCFPNWQKADSKSEEQ